ncbi:potassium/proton antiporter [Parvularcula marina]|uniref:Potassium/proton antiporter n=1 Tax=Parvularcula marina TaxID=2292771 RepID=A0A371RHP4_9PROT|nr:potassium/proton antiporter [Parvularcula marina]RFB04974.1 potassium/proton antiporter [Parvularcula marina]
MESGILFISSLVLAGFLLIPLSRRLGAPILLLVLIGGMLVGEDGPGGVHFDDFEAAYSLGSLALAIILFSGGLSTPSASLRGALGPSVLLATAGVVITALLVGLAASMIIGIPFELALLLGAVVASTDAAATFLLIQQNRIELPERLRNTLVLESGINDPMAIFLTIAMTAVVNQGETLSAATLAEFAPMFLLQIGFGLLAGLSAGRVLAWILDRIHLPEGLYAPMALAGAMVVYSATASLGGSGFLAIYLCGLVVSGSLKRSPDRIIHFSEGLQWLSQIALFMMLGILVTPTRLIEVFIPALLIALALMFIARPAAVIICTLPFRLKLNETVYLSWVGLRGAVPIYLAILPVITPGPVDTIFFNTVFVIVVASLLMQGWSVTLSARLLGLDKAQKA